MPLRFGIPDLVCAVKGTETSGFPSRKPLSSYCSVMYAIKVWNSRHGLCCQRSGVMSLLIKKTSYFLELCDVPGFWISRHGFCCQRNGDIRLPIKKDRMIVV